MAVKLAEILIEDGLANCNVNQQDPATGFTTLHVAASLGDTAMVELLLKHGAKITESKPMEDTAEPQEDGAEGGKEGKQFQV